jgi:hypothetical protein
VYDDFVAQIQQGSTPEWQGPPALLLDARALPSLFLLP